MAVHSLTHSITHSLTHARTHTRTQTPHSATLLRLLLQPSCAPLSLQAAHVLLPHSPHTPPSPHAAHSTRPQQAAGSRHTVQLRWRHCAHLAMVVDSGAQAHSVAAQVAHVQRSQHRVLQAPQWPTRRAWHSLRAQ